MADTSKIQKLPFHMNEQLKQVRVYNRIQIIFGLVFSLIVHTIRKTNE
jgi:hypothetical protein